jgi:hypothetical protein
MFLYWRELQFPEIIYNPFHFYCIKKRDCKAHSPVTQEKRSPPWRRFAYFHKKDFFAMGRQLYNDLGKNPGRG